MDAESICCGWKHELVFSWLCKFGINKYRETGATLILVTPPFLSEYTDRVQEDAGFHEYFDK